MYFHSRADAGRELAQKLIKYQTKNCMIVALSPGSVLIGAQIAMKLHCNMMLLVSENINLPGETTPLGAVTSDSGITYNSDFSSGEIEAFNMEYYNYIEQQRRENMSLIHKLMDASGQVHKNILKNHIVILVSDGLFTGLSLDVAADFLKPVKVKRLIIATPVASVKAIDRMHLLADEIHCLNTPENFVSIDHYYEDNAVPTRQGIYKIIQNISLSWDR